MVIQLMVNHIFIQDFLVYKLIKNLIYKNIVNKNENKSNNFRIITLVYLVKNLLNIFIFHIR